MSALPQLPLPSPPRVVGFGDVIGFIDATAEWAGDVIRSVSAIKAHRVGARYDPYLLASQALLDALRLRLTNVDDEDTPSAIVVARTMHAFADAHDALRSMLPPLRDPELFADGVLTNADIDARFGLLRATRQVETFFEDVGYSARVHGDVVRAYHNSE